MHCPNCGLANDNNARFCANCGTPFSNPQPQNYPVPATGGNSTAKNIGIGCLIAVGIFLFVGISCTRSCFGLRRRTNILRRVLRADGMPGYRVDMIWPERERSLDDSTRIAIGRGGVYFAGVSAEILRGVNG
jgi:hypothetical protein